MYKNSLFLFLALALCACTQTGTAITPTRETQATDIPHTPTVSSITDTPSINVIPQEQETTQDTPASQSENSGEAVDGWVGTLVSNPPGAQFDDYFQLQDQEDGRYGIDGSTDEIRLALEAYRDSGTLLKVWGTLIRDCPDMNGMQIQVTRIEEYQP